MQKVQDVLRHTHYRIDVLEKKLAQQITIDNRESLESELTSAKEVLKRNEEKLLKLRKSNTGTFVITACIIFLIFLIYGIYSMIYNKY